MQVGDYDELRKILANRRVISETRPTFQTGLHELDRLASGGSFQCGAVHELLWPPRFPSPRSIALLMARGAQRDNSGNLGGTIVWSDPAGELNPTALGAWGIDLRQFIILRCPSEADELWALSECLRTGGVRAVVASLRSLSQVAARRLQLAAEQGGGAGIFLRPFTPASAHYAAATRWLVQPQPTDPGKEGRGSWGGQRWSVKLLHGHGGHGNSVLLEADRETGALHISAPLADRPAAAPPRRITA
ncbi:MAG TPA: hypothetical protein VMD30_03370 [Tepidisphaeraceae bacterium]|nr:hypothetical protein [Tepidisphaeraceae bacterium]